MMYRCAPPSFSLAPCEGGREPAVVTAASGGVSFEVGFQKSEIKPPARKNRSLPPSQGGKESRIVKRRGKSLRIDLHCHYANVEVAARLADRNPGQYEP